MHMCNVHSVVYCNTAANHTESKQSSGEAAIYTSIHHEYNVKKSGLLLLYLEATLSVVIKDLIAKAKAKVFEAKACPPSP